MVDGEVLELRIALAGWRVIVAVVGKRKIAGAHRLAQHGQADALDRAEQHLHGFFALSLGQFVPEQPGGRIGERGAEAVDLLVLHGVVHGDGEVGCARRAESQRRPFPERLMLLFGGLDHLDARTLRRRRGASLVLCAGNTRQQ